MLAKPETHTYKIRASDELLFLSTDGLYKTFSVEYVAQRAYGMRKAGVPLEKIAQTIVKECPCTDNVTLLIVSLHEYY